MCNEVELYEFDRDITLQKEPKNIHYVKREGAFDHSTVTRWLEILPG